MQIAEAVSHSAATYHQNERLLARSFAGLTDEEWLKQPDARCNHLLWILGHVLGARGTVLRLLGTEWSKPWFPLFARGAKLAEAGQYPSHQELEAALQEVTGVLAKALAAASTETLAAPAPAKIPSFDGTLGGTVEFLAYHETYHVGQAAYLRTWMGHDGVTG